MHEKPSRQNNKKNLPSVLANRSTKTQSKMNRNRTQAKRSVSTFFVSWFAANRKKKLRHRRIVLKTMCSSSSRSKDSTRQTQNNPGHPIFRMEQHVLSVMATDLFARMCRSFPHSGHYSLFAWPPEVVAFDPMPQNVQPTTSCAHLFSSESHRSWFVRTNKRQTCTLYVYRI